MAKLHRFPSTHACYHVITSTLGRSRALENPRLAHVVMESVEFVRADRAFVLAYAVMPDHLHVVLVPREPFTLPQIMQTIKGYSSREINRLRASNGPFWQRSYYDRVIRNERQLRDAIDYVERNPVTEGLAKVAEDYRFSSAFSGNTTDLEVWLHDAHV